jgi:hypothetical protein
MYKLRQLTHKHNFIKTQCLILIILILGHRVCFRRSILLKKYLGGRTLKKFRRAEGGAKIFGVFRVKNHDFTLNNPILGGGAREGGPPPESAPVFALFLGLSLGLKESIKKKKNKLNQRIQYPIFFNKRFSSLFKITLDLNPVFKKIFLQ